MPADSKKYGDQDTVDKTKVTKRGKAHLVEHPAADGGRHCSDERVDGHVQPQHGTCKNISKRYTGSVQITPQIKGHSLSKCLFL